MDSFIVSARKYRPATFDTVVGQSHITTTLKNAIRTNHLAQAFLFCGPRGVGKTTCARILAKTINCQHLTNAIEPCDQCESCVSFNQNTSFNSHELDAASNNSVEDIRNLIDQVRYPPQSGKYKIYIIDEVHMLSQAAFNAFLKTLEEPPSYAIFILATTEKHKILPTILSRCQIFDFNRIQPNDIANHLAAIAQKETIRAEYEALALIAQKANGGLRDALSMFDLNVTFSADGSIRYQDVLENLHILDYDYYFRLTHLLLESNLSQSLLLFDEILRKGFDAHAFLVGLGAHFRDLLICKDEATVQLLQVTESVQQKYLDQATKAPMSFLLSALSLISQCDLNYKSAKNQRLHIEIGLMKLAHLVNALEINALWNSKENQEGGESVEKKKNNSTNGKPLEPDPILHSITSLKGTSLTSTSRENYVLSKNGKLETTNPTPFPSAPTIPKPTASRLRSTTVLQGAPPSSQTESTSTTSEDILVLAEKSPSTNQDDKPFIFEQLKAAWQEFASIRERNGGNSTEQVILNRDIVLDNTTIHISLDNTIQVDLLNDLRQELVAYLRQQLQNSQIQIIHQVASQEIKRIIYTNQDKFDYLTEKNPTLLDLKRTLGLDINY